MTARDLKVYWRFLKARMTGVTPCSYYSMHGHDLEPYKSFGAGSGYTLLTKCAGCGTIVSHNAVFGSCIEKDNRPELRS